MSLTPDASALHVAEVRRAVTARALGAVRDDARDSHVEGGAVAPDLHGTDRDAVEHERQSRLRRWQADR